MRTALRLSALVLVLSIALLAAGPARAAGVAAAPGQGASAGLDLLVVLWDQARCALGARAYCAPRSAWFGAVGGTGTVPGGAGKRDCTIDPGGRCLLAVGSAGRTAEWKCILEPSGRCIVPYQGDTLDLGCTIDPNGRCLP